MNALKIALRENRTRFRPGETIAGVAAWMLEKEPQTVELRLFWFTRGKGTQNVNVVLTIRFDHPKAEESRPFQLALPEYPYSFSGKLISLIWALELVVNAGEAERVELTLSPTGQEILLQAVDDVGRKAAATR